MVEFGELNRLATAIQPRYQRPEASTPRVIEVTAGTCNDCPHGVKRAGGNCAFLSFRLTQRGLGVRHVFVATFTKETVLSAGFAGAKPPPSR
jgi:hypothetical protein